MPTRRQFLHGAAALAAGGLASPLGVTAAPATEPRFKLGLVTYNVARKWDLKTLLRVCKQLGLAAVEARTTHAHGIEPTLSPAKRKEVKRRFEDAGVAFWGPGSVCEFHFTDRARVKKNIEDCKRFVQLAADLGGLGVKVRPNMLPKGVPEEKTLEQIGKALIPCGKAAADAGVEVCVEVHGRGTARPDRMKRIMDECGLKSVGVTWNCNPKTDFIDGGIEKSFAMLKPYIKSCHIKEVYKEALGGYPYRTLFRLLREAGYDRYTKVEVGYTPPNVQAGIEMLRYYKALWLELTRV